MKQQKKRERQKRSERAYERERKTVVAVLVAKNEAY
jgi:hypothetical protein